MSAPTTLATGTGAFAHGARVIGILAVAAAVALWSLAAPALGQQSGRAVALSSDTLSLNGRAIQLFGIDGMDFTQSCFVDGQAQACGASATRALQTLLDPAPVTCTQAGDAVGGVTFARCTGADGDIAEKMVQQGWALAVRTQAEDYVAAEDSARAAGAGIWRGTFMSPWDYRVQVQAIETDYARRAADSARMEAEAAITAGNVGIVGFDKAEYRKAAAAADPEQMADHEVAFADFAPGFITAAVPPPGVFEWRAVAGVLETTRRAGVAAITDSVRDALWAGLADRPSRTAPSTDAESFYAALRAGSAGWIAAGRQPVLFVKARDVPGWIRDWFGGHPPVGATITRRDDVEDARYLGTIDGVDVYVGPARDRASLLFPSDLLAEVTFRSGEDGNVLALDVDPDAGNAWTARYAMALRWLDDEIVWIEYPQASAATPDA
jgi:endonuclease YncB( thermonuclease family)